ncbi:MAG: methyltransferase domain-containing protein, partial [Caulobacteraceae bacterium]
MTPGRAARRLLGPVFPLAGGLYRRVFVDMRRVAEFIAARLPKTARVLDVGGGDGLLADLLLDAREDITVAILDLAAEVGGFVRQRHLPRTQFLPRTAIDEVQGRFDAMIMADVLHHVELIQRAGFLTDAATAAARTGCGTIFVKDIQPG